MSIRLDPRRLGTLKQLAADAGMRPGDLVRHWVEERIDAARGGGGMALAAGGGGGRDLIARLDELAARVAALETAGDGAPRRAPAVTPVLEAEGRATEAVAAEPEVAPETETAVETPAPLRRSPKRVSAAPTSRVPLHDEMIAVLAERGPMTAGELAAAVAERGRYAPPRSAKPLDAAMISQRVSNPTYRARFTRSEGRIGLAQPPGTSATAEPAPEA